ncbi:MAG TPA: hypothetical protein VMB20_01195 [Candidatus Acidoferrum sp.]|nr:hypothetical protein [Candidatus Acidoferrum sp.]
MQRSSFLISAVPLAACATAACAGTSGETIGLVETAAQFDRKAFERAVATGAQFRQVWDAGAIQPRMLGGVKNALNGLAFGFDVASSNIAVAFVTHNTSNLLLYDDSAWSTYLLGQLFGIKDPTGAVVQTNIFYPSHATGSSKDPNDPHGFYQDASISTLQQRGVRFFVCNTALIEHAEVIVNAGASKQTVDEVARALRAHLVPGAMLVPSGVAAITYLQSRHGYAYMTGS